jgi:hypothetical protein
MLADVSEQCTASFFRPEDQVKQEASRKERFQFLVGYSLDLLFDPEHDDNTFLRSNSKLLPDYTASYFIL